MRVLPAIQSAVGHGNVSLDRFEEPHRFLFARKGPFGHIQGDVVAVGEKKMVTKANKAIDRRPIAGVTFGRAATLEAFPVEGCY